MVFILFKAPLLVLLAAHPTWAVGLETPMTGHALVEDAFKEPTAREVASRAVAVGDTDHDGQMNKVEFDQTSKTNEGLQEAAYTAVQQLEIMDQHTWSPAFWGRPPIMEVLGEVLGINPKLEQLLGKAIRKDPSVKIKTTPWETTITLGLPTTWGYDPLSWYTNRYELLGKPFLGGTSILRVEGLRGRHDLLKLVLDKLEDKASVATLHLEYNLLTTLPAGVFTGLIGLTTLWLDHNRLTTLPAEVFTGLKSLTTLYLHDNRLTTLPAEVFKDLTSLTTLYLHDNRLTTYPAGFTGRNEPDNYAVEMADRTADARVAAQAPVDAAARRVQLAKEYQEFAKEKRKRELEAARAGHLI